MSLRKKINEQFNIVLKNKDKSSISTLRLILAAIKERDIANRSDGKKEEVKDPEIIKVLKKMKKQRQDSADLYKKGNRKELLEIEESEIEIIDTFLPKQFSEEETKKICEDELNILGAADLKDMGKVMGELKKKHSEKLDFSKAGAIVKELLTKPKNGIKKI